jgi:hypothetical protein
MEIRLDIDETNPLTGAVTADGRTSDFGGWLGLLRVLSETLAPSPDVVGLHPTETENGEIQ